MRTTEVTDLDYLQKSTLHDRTRPAGMALVAIGFLSGAIKYLL
jgi:hypothetical protein